MDNCKGLIGRLLGHRYEPRYSFGEPKVQTKLWGVFSSDMAGIITASKPKTYHCDVCVRCGHKLTPKRES